MNNKFEILAKIPRLRNLKETTLKDLVFLINDDPTNSIPEELKVFDQSKDLLLLGGILQNRANPFKYWLIIYNTLDWSIQHVAIPLPNVELDFGNWVLHAAKIGSNGEIITLESWIEKSDSTTHSFQRYISTKGELVKQKKISLDEKSLTVHHHWDLDEEKQTWKNTNQSYSRLSSSIQEEIIQDLSLQISSGFYQELELPNSARNLKILSLKQTSPIRDDYAFHYHFYLITNVTPANKLHFLEIFSNILINSHEDTLYISKPIIQNFTYFISIEKFNLKGDLIEQLKLLIPEKYNSLKWHFSHVDRFGNLYLFGEEILDFHTRLSLSTHAIQGKNNFSTLCFNAKGVLISDHLNLEAILDESLSHNATVLSEQDWKVTSDNISVFQKMFLSELRENKGDVNSWLNSQTKQVKKEYEVFKEIQTKFWQFHFLEGNNLPKPKFSDSDGEHLTFWNPDEQQKWYEEYYKYALYLQKWKQELFYYWFEIKKEYLGISPIQTNLKPTIDTPDSWFFKLEENYILMPIYAPEFIYVLRWNLSTRDNFRRLEIDHHYLLFKYLASHLTEEDKVNEYYLDYKSLENRFEVSEIAPNHISRITNLSLFKGEKLNLKLLLTCRTLCNLSLHSTKIKNIEALLDLPLTSLSLNNCTLSEKDLAVIYQLPHLNSLTLIDNEITHFDFRIFKYPQNILSLTISKNGLKNILGIEHFKNLVWLDLTHNQIEDVNPFENAEFKDLRNIELLNNNIKEIEAIHKLAENRYPEQLTIRIHNNPIIKETAEILNLSFTNMNISYGDYENRG